MWFEMSFSQASLKAILLGKDERHDKQLSVIKAYGAPIIALTLNIPGANKDMPYAKALFLKGVDAIQQSLKAINVTILYSETFHNAAGYYLIISLQADAFYIKDMMVHIESTHPLGRLFDIDVRDINHKLISRYDLGIEPRKCFACNELAAICRRNQSHSEGELLMKIQHMIENHL